MRHQEVLQNRAERIPEQVNLASESIAISVDKDVNSLYYSEILGALQSAARRLGFSFVKAEDGIPFSFLGIAPSPTEAPPAWQLAYAISLRRACYLYPYATLSGNERMTLLDIADGYGYALLRDILYALERMGIHLQVASTKCTPCAV